MGHGLTLDYGLRWDAQLMPVNRRSEDDGLRLPAQRSRAFRPMAPFRISGSSFSRGVGVAWDVNQDGQSVVRASTGVFYARQNMLSQVGSVTTNGVQQKSDYRDSTFHGVCRHAGLAEPARAERRAARHISAVHRRARVRPRLPESAHLQLQCRIRTRVGDQPCRVRGLHNREKRASDALPELQRPRHGSRGHPAGRRATRHLRRSESIRAAAGRRVRHRTAAGTDCTAAARSACGSASRNPISSKRITCCRRTKTTTRTSAIRSPIGRSTSTI